MLCRTDDNTNCRVDTAIIQRRLPVLLKYLNSDTERQLQALYALQALIVTLDQPPSKCCTVVYSSYILLQMKVIFLCLLPLHFTEFTFCFHQVLRNVIVGGLTKGPLRSGSQAVDHVT